MERQTQSRSDSAAAVVLFIILAVLSLVNFSTVYIKPNVFLAVLVAASFVIESWYVFFGFLIAELLWLKFTPSFLVEYAVFGLLGLCTFVVVKLLVFEHQRVVRIATVLIFQALFWIALQSADAMISLVFLLEFVYNVIIEEILFALGSWLKKKFS